MNGDDTPRWPGLALAAVLGVGVLALLLWGTVTIGAGDSEGFQRPARDILRAADRALMATGWSDRWRIAAWACGGVALAASVPLVWAASRVRDAAAPDCSPGAASASTFAEDAQRFGANGGSGIGPIDTGPDAAEAASGAGASGRPA